MTDAAKDLPAWIADVAALEELVSRPSPELVQALSKVPGDIMVLGVCPWRARPTCPIRSPPPRSAELESFVQARAHGYQGISSKT